MSMQGTRFVLGLAAGLLFGFAVIISSAFTFGTFGTFGTFSPASGLQNLGSNTSTTQTASTVTGSVTANGTAPAVPASASNSTQATSTNSSGKVSASGGNVFYQSSFTPAHISRLDSIAQQPIALTAYALIPVIVAFLFGLVLYRASRTNTGKDRRPETP